MATTAKQQTLRSKSSTSTSTSTKSNSQTTAISSQSITQVKSLSPLPNSASNFFPTPSPLSESRISSSSSGSQSVVEKSSRASIGLPGGAGGNYLDTENDIATIAKQISDHAEAIYQSWKARGLAPTEILNCTTSATHDAFGKALTASSPHSRNSSDSPVADLLSQTPAMSNNNLEKLVSSFVNEDKARQQAARKNTGSNILTSGTIKDALRKFESNSSSVSYVKPNFLAQRKSVSPSNSTKSTTFQKSLSTQPQLNKNVPDVLIDTISQQQQIKSLPKDKSLLANNVSSTIKSSSSSSTDTALTSPALAFSLSSVTSSTGNTSSSNNSFCSLSSNVKKPQTPAKPASLINHTPSWPLKNRSVTSGISISSSEKSSSASFGVSTIDSSSIDTLNSCALRNSVRDGAANKDELPSISHKKSQVSKSKLEPNRNSADLLDEVSREEERLINALKTGIVLDNRHSSNHKKLSKVIISTLSAPKDLISDNKVNSICSTDKSNITATNQLTTAATISTNCTTTTTTAAKVILSSPTIQSSTTPTAEWNGDDRVDSSTGINQQSVPLSGSSGGIKTTSVINSNLQSKLNDTIATAATLAMSPAPAPAGLGKLKLRPKNDAAVPHPDTKNSNITIHNHNSNASSRTNNLNPVRPFLTRGSVAERVLMFEKCPDVKAPLRIINREPPKVTSKPSSKLEPEQTHTTLQRHVRSSSKNVYIPRFHFPHGKPLPTIALETTLQRLVSAFDSLPKNQAKKEDLSQILKICGLPLYWRMPLMACTQHATSGLVDGYRFVDFWKQMSVYCHDTASRFVYILSRGQRSRPYILHEDLATLVQDVVDTHPGLAFLKEASEFHSRYVHTVIARIFYSVNRSWSGKITVPELKRSNLLQVIQLLEEEEDINQIMAFFSYEHFYVIYCKFWELDRDHDLFIDQNDLARHNDHALSTRIIERIFSGCVTRGGKTRIMGPSGPKMSYTDFVWFLLSEEDKTNATAIEYWFRCMDLDGDGIISMYELEYFYEEQQQRMESIGIETLPFEDCLCQMLDMIKPIMPGCVTLGDLKRCRMTPIFFDTFFNLEKYLEHEQRDPFASQRDNDDITDWDRYAAQEYELLVAEEGGDTQGSYDEEEDYESNIDILESQLDDMTNIINEW